MLAGVRPTPTHRCADARRELDRAGADVLIAYERNAASLTAEHGAPARLVAPG